MSEMTAPKKEMMQKVVINVEYGGFGLSPEATLWLWEKGYRDKEFCTHVDEYFSHDSFYEENPSLGLKARLNGWREYQSKKEQDSLFLTVFTPDEKHVLYARDIERSHPLLIECIETLGEEKASGRLVSLKIVEIPADVDWVIEEYDGREWIAEKHRIWP